MWAVRGNGIRDREARDSGEEKYRGYKYRQNLKGMNSWPSKTNCFQDGDFSTRSHISDTLSYQNEFIEIFSYFNSTRILENIMTYTWFRITCKYIFWITVFFYTIESSYIFTYLGDKYVIYFTSVTKSKCQFFILVFCFVFVTCFLQVSEKRSIIILSWDVHTAEGCCMYAGNF